MHRRALLSYWQEAWKPLSEPLRSRFLARPEVEELASMPDETARMAIRAHAKLALEIPHAQWLLGERRSTAGCGCTVEVEDVAAGEHKLFMLAGPDSRVGRSGPRSSTVAARCACGWEKRGASEGLLRALWHWHVMGEDEEPVAADD